MTDGHTCSYECTRPECVLSQRDALYKLVESYIKGDYPNPRTYRPKPCEHGQHWWEECTDCADDFIENGLRDALGEK